MIQCVALPPNSWVIPYGVKAINPAKHVLSERLPRFESDQRFNDGFLKASTPASNGVGKGSPGRHRLAETARTIGALSAGISLPRPASPQSLSPFLPAFAG